MPGQPVATYLTCPRCHIRRLFVNVDGGQTFRCSGCEWFESLTAVTPKAALSGAHSIGATALTLPTPSQPGVPASGTPVTNTNAYDVRVTITGGTMTNVVVNGVSVGTGAGVYTVPAGQQITLTYTVAPTWAWASPGTLMTAGMQLLVDTGTAAEVVTVTSTGTATNVPVTALTKAHSSAVAAGLLSVGPTYSGVGQDAVPAAPGWGF